jgi:hypothetical protein
MMALDYLLRFVIPLCSAMQDRPDRHLPVTSAVYLADLDNISFRLAWNLRTFAQQISTLLATCYPEVVDTIYVNLPVPSLILKCTQRVLEVKSLTEGSKVLNTPSYIAKIWAFLKAWIDPRTANKLVFLTPAEGLDKLLETIDIESIPEHYGGKSKASHGKFPCLDDSAKQLLGVEALPEGPIKWITDPQGGRTAVAVGTRNGEMRHDVVGTIGPS